jgi:hypothetical protein
MELVTEVTEADNANLWNPVPNRPSWVAIATFFVWTVGQPVLDIALLREPSLVSVPQRLVRHLANFIHGQKWKKAIAVDRAASTAEFRLAAESR